MQVCQNSAEMSKRWWVLNVKTLQVCQNSAGYFCQNGAGSEQFQYVLDCIIFYYIHTTNASPIIERGKRVTMQSEDWLMTTSNPKSYLRGVINLVNSLCLLYPLYSFVPQLYTNLLGFGYKSSPNIECSERLMRQNENITMIIATSVTDLMIDTSLVNSFRQLCLL